MTPDLGKYADAVLSAYGASLTLLAVLVAISLWKGKRVRSDLAQVEARAGQSDG
jgi:heme exporter protein D